MPSVEAASNIEAVFLESSDGIAIRDSSGAITRVNAALERLTGYSERELRAGGLLLLFPRSNDAKREDFPRAKPLSAETINENGRHEDIMLRVRTGEVKIVEFSVSPSMMVIRDTTEKRSIEQELLRKHQELRNMQETLVQAGKLAALGELSAGIAHELNQPLQGVRGFVQELISNPKLEEKDRSEYLAEIVKNVDRMARIIQDLRSFTKQSTKDFGAIDVGETVENALRLIGKQLSNNGVTIQKKISEDLPRAYANANQLQQVVINLLTNAKDAIRAKGTQGTVRIEARRESKDFVVLSVSDDGIGMDESVMARIFDPFYTTKQAGEGMGLGLSLSLNLMNRMKGTILVESKPDRGSTFSVRIPVAL